MHTDLNDDTAHGGANLAAVGNIGLGTSNVVDRGLVVVDSDLADLTVDLVEDLTLTSVLGERSNGKQLQDQHLTLLQLNVELLANLGTGQEVPGGQDGQVTVLLHEFAVVLEDPGVHGVTGHIALGSGSKLLLEISLDLGKVQGLQEETRALVELATVTQGPGAQRLRESTIWLTHETLEEFKDRAGEVQLASAGDDIVGGQLVGHHKLGEITDHLGSGSDLDYIAQQIIGSLISLLRLGPLLTQTQLAGLEDEIGQLTTRDFVLIDLFSNKQVST